MIRLINSIKNRHLSCSYIFPLIFIVRILKPCVSLSLDINQSSDNKGTRDVANVNTNDIKGTSVDIELRNTPLFYKSSIIYKCIGQIFNKKRLLTDIVIAASPCKTEHQFLLCCYD